MLKNSNGALTAGARALSRPARFWLQIAAGVLAVLNAVALYLYVWPPGGTRTELVAERRQLQNEIAATRARAAQLKKVSTKVQLGNEQSSEFEAKYILPKRLAYEQVIGEIQRIAKMSGLQERDAVYSLEPVEGTADLTLLNSTANYEGTYENLKKFLYEVDHSPMLIILENLQASPQQRGNQINTNIRFQAMIRDEAPTAMRGQP